MYVPMCCVCLVAFLFLLYVMLKVLRWTVIGRNKVPGKINCVWFRNRRATVEMEKWPWEKVRLLKIACLDSELRTNSIFGFFSSVRAECFSVGWIIVGPRCGLTFVSEILLCCALNFWSDYIWEVVFQNESQLRNMALGKCWKFEVSGCVAPECGMKLVVTE